MALAPAEEFDLAAALPSLWKNTTALPSRLVSNVITPNISAACILPGAAAAKTL